ncbi:PQQ-binding-like beta-propeller repeat protein [Planctomycetota bacterium]|nr:PQQ-binding-like beta-propeller repeat protein [Planctomycetota bacterium]
MKLPTRALSCLPPALVALALLSSCGTSQARPSTRDVLEPDPTTRQSKVHYQSQLAELPLSMHAYDLSGPTATSPIIVRELHVVHDGVRDEVLVVDANDGGHLWSLDAYEFTLNWRAVIEGRTSYDPVATQNYVFLMDSDGSYQAYSRMARLRKGESRLAAMGRFGGDLFPSAQPSANDTHVFVPATNTNSLKGLSMLSNARGESAESWSFPHTGGQGVEEFLQISIPPVSDRETAAFVNNNNYLYLVDAQSGEFRARAYLEARSRTTPLIKDDLIFVGSDNGMVYAWQKSGEAAFTFATDGLPHGEFFVEDGWVFVRTLEVYDEEVTDEDGEVYVRANTRPGKLNAYRYRTIDIENDRPVYEVIDGDPSTPGSIEPVWSEADVGQQVMMVSGEHVYVLYEENEEYLTERELAQFRGEGRLVKKSEELRTKSRQLKVLDANTGKLSRSEWNINMMDFPYIRGSMVERDRALYVATKDGYVFRLFVRGANAGGK